MKKAPKTITSEMMNSSIPSSWGSTRELRFAGGGPWWWSSWADAARADGGGFHGLRPAAGGGRCGD